MNTLEIAMSTPAQRQVTALQCELEKLPQVPCPLEHQFVGQFYVRTIRVPAGTLVVSQIFKADFPFFISQGRVSIWMEGQGVVHRQAPYWGQTKAATRRMIMHHTDVEWTTFHHVGDNRNVEQIEADIAMKGTP